MARTAFRGSARPDLFQSSQSYLAFCVAMLALIGYFVWHLSDTRLGRAMRAVRDNELAAGVVGIDVFRTKVSAFALSAVLGGLAGGLFRRWFRLCQPGPVLLRRVGGVSSPCRCSAASPRRSALRSAQVC